MKTQLIAKQLLLRATELRTNERSNKIKETMIGK